jgi:hypothetical protein
LGDIEKKDGRLIASAEYRVKKFMIRHKNLFIQDGLNEKNLREINNKLPDAKRFMCISHKEDGCENIIISLLMKRGTYDDVIVINGYKLVEIMLSKDAHYQCLSEVKANLVIIYITGKECTNKSLQEVVNQVISNQYMDGKECYLIYKGSDLKSKYPQVYDNFKGIHAEIVNIDNSKVNCEEEIAR